jgi:hypothetical protein
MPILDLGEKPDMIRVRAEYEPDRNNIFHPADCRIHARRAVARIYCPAGFLLGS